MGGIDTTALIVRQRARLRARALFALIKMDKGNAEKVRGREDEEVRVEATAMGGLARTMKGDDIRRIERGSYSTNTTKAPTASAAVAATIPMISTESGRRGEDTEGRNVRGKDDIIMRSWFNVHFCIKFLILSL